jgi:ubiquinone/menaquinone biosynthesis C-methylase UbiE
VSTEDQPSEAERIERVYAGYESEGARERWDSSNPGNDQIISERVEATIQLLKDAGVWPPNEARVLDVGCGEGKEVMRFVDWGTRPGRITGADLLAPRIRAAHERYPEATFVRCDGTQLPFPDASFTVVCAITLFSSVLDDGIRESIANEMDRVLEPGGIVLWYDMRIRNYGNRQVRPVPRRELERLFPHFATTVKTITLIPPLARKLGGLASVLYPALAAVPVLRSHHIAILRKP